MRVAGVFRTWGRNVTEYRVAESSNPGLVSGRIDPKDVEGLINAIAADGGEFVALTAQGVSAYRSPS